MVMSRLKTHIPPVRRRALSITLKVSETTLLEQHALTELTPTRGRVTGRGFPRWSPVVAARNSDRL